MKKEYEFLSDIKINKLQTLTYFISILFSQNLLAVTFDELYKLDNHSYQVIDSRTSDIYNGWTKSNKQAGGHFPNSINFPAEWLKILTDEEIKKLLVSRKLKTDKPTYIYGDSESRENLKEKLLQLNFSTVNIIKWPVSDFNGALISLKNYQHLVPASWLNDLINGNRPPHAPNKDYKIIEVAWGKPVRYIVSHIPGALYLDTNLIESEANQWNIVSPDALKKVLEQLGVTHDTTTILYSKNNMAAARAANIFLYAGVKDVRLLDGGWQSWKQKGYPTDFSIEKPQPAAFGKEVPAHPELIIDIAKAKEYLTNPDNSSLVSIRSWEEYTGKTTGYNYIQHTGRIDGARWGHAGSDAYHLEDFHNPDGTMISAELIRKFWQEWGITKNQQVAFHCGTGWRASEAFFYAYLMGWSDIAVFDGGWYEWSKDSSNPVAHGELPSLEKTTVH